MKKLLWIAGGVFAVLIVVALTVPFLVPASVYKAQIEKAASESLAREVVLSGDAKLSVFPRIAARIEGVTVANAEGFPGEAMIDAGELRGSVKWLPLLSRRVEVQELAFTDAKVVLHKKADGTVNWDLEAFKPKTDESGQEIDAAIDKATLKNATLTYTDEQAGTAYTFSEVDLNASMKALNQPLNAKGSGKFQGEAFDVSLKLDSAELLSDKQPAGIVFDLKSTLGDVNYDGTLQTAETVMVDGAFNAGSDALAALASFAGVKIDFDLAQLGSVTVKGRLSGPAETVKVTIEEASQKSDLMQAGFAGDLMMGPEPKISGAATLKAADLGALMNFAKIELPVDAAALGSLDASAKLSGLMTAPDLAIEAASVKSKLLAASYTGTVKLGEQPVLDGTFKADLADAGEVAKALGVKLDAPQLFKKVSATGTLKGPADKLALTGISASHEGPDFAASYKGAVGLGEPLVLDGAVTASLPRAGDFARALKIEISGQDAIEKIDVSARVKGPMTTLALSDIDLEHSGALINAAYKGTMQLGGDGRLAGNFSASSDQLRGLLKASQIEMAPGETLQRFAAKGAVSGSFKQLAFSGLELNLDAIKAKGKAGLDLSAAKPRLTGDLDMGALDLTPFLGAPPSGQTKGFSGWSQDPLDLAGLKSVDSDLKLRTTALKIGKVTLTNAAVLTKLDQGRLEANLPAFQVFDGTWSGKLFVDASGNVPTVQFVMQGQGVEMANMLGTLANFARLDGAGAFKIEATGRGASIDAIMKDLDGSVSTNLANGALKGFNVAQAVRSADTLRQAVTTGNLRNLDFSGVLSPAAATDFTQFDAVLKIDNGVAKVDLMKLLNPVLGIDGTGQIDLGWQKLDVRLATAIDKKGKSAGSVVQLNGIPVPVRLSGNWAAIKVTPDLSGVESALRAEAGGKVRDTITDRIGATGGGIASDVLGLPKREPPAPVTGAPATRETVEPAPEPAKKPTLEELGKKKAADALGGLLGKKKPAPAPPADPPADAAPPPVPAPQEPAPADPPPTE